MAGRNITSTSRRSPEPLSKDDIFTVLSNERRRFVLRYLKDHGGTAEIRDLSQQVAAWENDVPIAKLNYKQRKRVYTSLHQTHLPKLDDTGIVEYDRDRKTVELTDRIETLDIYLEVVPENDIPWSQYYLGLAAVSLAVVAAAWFDLFPFSLLPDIAFAVLVAGALGISAAVHTYYTRSLGEGQSPVRSATPHGTDGTGAARSADGAGDESR
jgi:DNA-binding transcriptional ArsR family regulator